MSKENDIRKQKRHIRILTHRKNYLLEKEKLSSWGKDEIAALETALPLLQAQLAVMETERSLNNQ
jgi:hypothetical protein